MKLTDEEFQKLREQWYKTLEDTGFKDIEKSNDKLEADKLVRLQKAHSFFDQNGHLVNAKQEYFQILFQTVNDSTVIFHTELDKYILTRYAEGARIKTIVDELKKMNTPRGRDSIRFIIKRYEKKWGIRKLDE